jgi:hypothetical protein
MGIDITTTLGPCVAMELTPVSLNSIAAILETILCDPTLRNRITVYRISEDDMAVEEVGSVDELAIDKGVGGEIVFIAEVFRATVSNLHRIPSTTAVNGHTGQSVEDLVARLEEGKGLLRSAGFEDRDITIGYTKREW